MLHISGDDIEPANSEESIITQNGMVIGIVLGACAVLFIVFLAFLGYKIYRRRRHQKKYQGPPVSRGATPMQQVTLLPIAHHPAHTSPHPGERLEIDHHRVTSALLTQTDSRPPPSYSESFLDNGGPVVAV